MRDFIGMSLENSNLGKCERKRILIETSPGIWRYIAKIIPYGKSDGGFAVVPAYESNEVGILKLQVFDSFSHLISPPDPVSLDYKTISNGWKVSFHSDGMTQISGFPDTKIVTSGIDQTSSHFKGFGVRGRPFSAPVFTGAVFSMSIWGIHHYPRVASLKNSILFDRKHINSKFLASKGKYIIEIYIVRRKSIMNINNIDNRIICEQRRINGSLGILEDMRLNIFNLRSSEVFLGIRCLSADIKVDPKHPSGFMISTQRGISQNIGRTYKDVGLLVLCPAKNRFLPSGTLDRGIIVPKIIMPYGRSIK